MARPFSLRDGYSGDGARMRIAILCCCLFSLHAAISDSERALLRDEMIPACRAEFDRQSTVPSYRITAAYDDATATITGRLSLRVVNTATTPWATICLQTLANAEIFHEAAQTLDSVRLDGVELPQQELEDRTAVEVRLPQLLAVGAAIELEIAFTTVVSKQGGDHGLLNRSDDLLCLYNWYPELALFREGAWEVHPLGEIGDPTRTVSANVVATLTLPAAWVVAGSGAIHSEPAASATVAMQTVHIVVPLARNVAIVAGLGLEALSCTQDGVTIASWFPAGCAVGGGLVRDTAARALTRYGRAFGAYPYQHFTAVAAPLGLDVGGMEATACIINDAQPYQTFDEHGPLAFMLRLVTAHEVGHQWWYGVIGSDAAQAPWLDESLTNWTSNWFIETELTPQEYLSGYQMLRMESWMGVRANLALSAPVENFHEMEEYGAVIYGTGALVIESLRRELGDERFFVFLRRYADANRFSMADVGAWNSALSAVWTPAAAAAFQAHWIDAPLAAADLWKLPGPKPPTQPRTKPQPTPMPQPSPP